MVKHLRTIKDYLALCFRDIISKLRFYRLIVTDKTILKELKRNSHLKNFYLDKEIIVFGNGPSSNDFNIDLIGSRFTFTVNYSMRSKNLAKLHSDFHVWADMGLFENNKLETMDSIRAQVLHSKFNIFLPIETKKDILSYNISSEKIHYFYSNKLLLENSSIVEDLTKNIHGYSTVVQWAIAISIYMGFKKIYLVGVETTNILSNINLQLGKNDLAGHAYEYLRNDFDFIRVHQNNNAMVTIAEGFFGILRNYKILNNQSNKIGVELINLTEKTLIDSIKKGSQDDLE